jgi:hypothetical protein
MVIERQKKFTINGAAFIAKFPNVGQLIDLESFKQALTSNRYGQMAASGVASMYQALDLVDAIAFFQVVVPEVGKRFDIKNYTQMSLDEIKHIVDAYQNEIKPWFDKTMVELKGIATDGGATESEK